MIIDCHAHVFQNWHGACGHPSIDVHLKYIQKNVTRPAAETFRVRDGMRVKPGLLFRDGDNTWAGLKDVGFRIGRYGRLEFMHEGEEYAIQYMPVGMQTIESPPEFMIAQMLYAGVDHCILQAGGGYGAMNDYNAFTQSRLSGEVHRAAAYRRGDGGSRRGARRGRPRARARPEGPLLLARLLAPRLRRATSITTRSARSGTRSRRGIFPPSSSCRRRPNYDRPSYIANLMALDRLMQRYPAHALRAGDGAAGRAFRRQRHNGISRPRCLPPTSATIC